MPILPLHVNDLIQLKKPHPCGGKIFRILRVGGEVRIVCQTCARDMNIDRIKLEKAIKQILPSDLEQAQERKGSN